MLKLSSDTKRSFIVRLFVLYLLILLLSLSSLILIWRGNIANTINELSSSNIKDVFNIANSNFENSLNDLYSVMNTIESNELTLAYLKTPNRDNAKKLRSYIDELCLLLSSNIQGIALMTNSDYVYGGYSYFTPKYKNYEWYQNVYESDGNSILFIRSDINTSHASTSAPRSNISIGKVIRQNGKTIGVLICDLKTSFILNLYGISTINNSLRTIILDEKGQVLFSSARETAGEYPADIIEVSEYKKHNNTLRTVILNGKEYTMISQKLNSTPGWINITYLPQEYLYRGYKKSLTFALSCTFLILLVSVALSYTLFHFWQNKLTRLCLYIEKIDITNPFSTKTPKLPDKKDELDLIYTRIEEMINVMISQLQTISQLEEKKHSYEIQVLKAQINPHLIYNTLNVIQTLAELQKENRIANISSSFSKLLHYSLENSDKLVPLDLELQHVGSYLDIMRNKFLNDISLYLTIEEELINCQMLKMTLQPLVENCIKHAFSDIPGNYVHIKAYRYYEDVQIKIIDNGKGIPKEKLTNLLADSPNNTGHLGLKNVDRRLKLTFGEKYGLKILSVPNVLTTILINIPYIQEENI